MTMDMTINSVKITNEMIATYTTIYYLEDLINNGEESEVTLHRLATRVTSHFKSVYSWYTTLDWDSKYEFMASMSCLLRMMERGTAFERFAAIDDNREKFDKLWEQVK